MIAKKTIVRPAEKLEKPEKTKRKAFKPLVGKLSKLKQFVEAASLQAKAKYRVEAKPIMQEFERPQNEVLEEEKLRRELNYKSKKVE